MLKLPEQEITLDSERSTAVFRITQEALTNIVTHANASQVRVEIDVDDKNLFMTIHDNGCGIPVTQSLNSAGYGIYGMRERARHFGGRLTICSQPESGTTINLSMPLQATESEKPND